MSDEELRDEIREPKKCPYFWAGHNTHWMEYFHEVKDAARRICTIEYLGGTAFQVVSKQETVIWHHHDPERLIEAVALTASLKRKPLRLLKRSTLVMPHNGGNYIFSMADQPLDPCPEPKGRTERSEA